MLDNNWKVEKKFNRTEYCYDQWKIIRYSKTDWSVYLMDSDGFYQYQLQYKRKKDAFNHCC